MSKPIKKIWINGVSGQMGRVLFQLVDDSDNHELVGGSSSSYDFKIGDDGGFTQTKIKDEDFDAVVDFSTPAGNAQLLDKLAKKKWRDGMVVIATTGITEQQLADWKRFSETNKLRVLVAPNTSVGANTFIAHAMEFSRLTGTLFPEVEITEKHHHLKKDSPSGTAKRLAEGILRTRPDLDTITIGRKGERAENEIGVHSLRGGTVTGEHTITFMGDYEEITMTHRAETRDIFAQGALVLIEWLFSAKKSGFYNLDDVFGIRL